MSMRPFGTRNHALTGALRVRPARERKGLLRSSLVFVLQVEETYDSFPYPMMGAEEDPSRVKKMRRWRDVEAEDLVVICKSVEPPPRPEPSLPFKKG